MPYVNLNLPEEMLEKATKYAKELHLKRSAFLRKAIDRYLVQTERELLAEQFRKASEKCRDESLAVCREFEAIEDNSVK